METITANVIVANKIKNNVEQHEIEAAWIIARHFNRPVEFLEPINDYMRKTPDVIIDGQLREIKSPIGKSRQNVERQLKRAIKQSQNIIFDGRRSSINDSILVSRLRNEAKKYRSLKKLIFVTKDEKILEMVWK